MEAYVALLALCGGNLPVTGKFPSQKPVTQSVNGLFDVRLKKGRSKHIAIFVSEVTPNGMDKIGQNQSTTKQTQIMYTYLRIILSMNCPL